MQFRGLHTDNHYVYIFMDYMKLGDLGKYIDFIWEEDDTEVPAELVSEVAAERNSEVAAEHDSEVAFAN